MYESLLKRGFDFRKMFRAMNAVIRAACFRVGSIRAPRNLLPASLMPETENCPCLGDERVKQLAEKGWKRKVCPWPEGGSSLASQLSKLCRKSSKISCSLSTRLLRTTVVGSVVLQIRSVPYRETRASPFHKLPSAGGPAASVLGLPAAHREQPA